MKILILFNFFISSFMFGIIMVTQIINYPLFLEVNNENFSNYHYYYVRKISILVIPIMLAEFLISLALLFFIDSYLSLVTLIIIVLIFLSTFFIQVPIHNKIKSGSDFYLFRKLINTNWISTLLWFTKCLISLNIIV